MLNKLLDGLEGKLTTSNWAAIARCSPVFTMVTVRNRRQRCDQLWFY